MNLPESQNFTETPATGAANTIETNAGKGSPDSPNASNSVQVGVVKASSFEVVGQNGNVVATIGAKGLELPFTSSVRIYDATGQHYQELSDTGLNLDEGSHIQIAGFGGSATDIDGSNISISGGKLQKGSSVDISPGTVQVLSDKRYAMLSSELLSLTLMDPDRFDIGINNIYGSAGLYLNAAGKQLRSNSFMLSQDGLSLFDSTGSERAMLGSASLITQNTDDKETTALSSLVLFDNKGHVSWRTP